MKVDLSQILDVPQKGGAAQGRSILPVLPTDTAVPVVGLDPLGGHVPQVEEGNTYGKPLTGKEEIMQQAAAATGLREERQKEMEVLSNTMTEEDFKEFKANGNSLEDMDSRDMLTVVDKIKIQMAKGGADVGEISASEDAIREYGGNAAETEKSLLF